MSGETRHGLFAKFRPIEHIFGGLGVFFLIGGIGLLIWTASFVARAEPAIATVISREVIASGSGSTNTPRFDLVVGFIDQNSAPQQARTSVTTSSDYAPIGATFEILYDPQNPDTIRIDDWMNTWGFIILILAGGLGFLGLAVWMRIAYLNLHKLR